MPRAVSCVNGVIRQMGCRRIIPGKAFCLCMLTFSEVKPYTNILRFEQDLMGSAHNFIRCLFSRKRHRGCTSAKLSFLYWRILITVTDIQSRTNSEEIPSLRRVGEDVFTYRPTRRRRELRCFLILKAMERDNEILQASQNIDDSRCGSSAGRRAHTCTRNAASACLKQQPYRKNYIGSTRISRNP